MIQCIHVVRIFQLSSKYMSAGSWDLYSKDFGHDFDAQKWDYSHCIWAIFNKKVYDLNSYSKKHII